ncbi:MAG: hypothetical protein ATN36_01110 [Epulopiscium sp. Nele67-Bin005]|nr:MAG: hypothetical protein ATN36_01110 [Epulopiscium sp. Nele67-Bin005]
MKKLLCLIPMLIMTGCQSSSAREFEQVQAEILESIQKTNSDQTSTYTNIAPYSEFSQSVKPVVIDGVLDLTNLSNVMMEAQIYEMIYFGDMYNGQQIKVHGTYQDYEYLNGEIDRVIFMADGLGCCEMGMLLLWEDEMPEEFPAFDATVEVVGTFYRTVEDHMIYCHIEVESLNLL